ncbi:MAG: HEAT repeat domain-containing protein [Chloroflexota bacterium]|nr:HEAT repeat domain-containing protein [Chloroflexota bacterium]
MSVLNDEILHALASPARAPRAKVLMALSDADSGSVRLLRASWGEIPVERRRLIVHRLVEIAEDNFEADFHQVLRIFLKDADPEVRATAVEGLWDEGSPAVMREVMALLKGDPSALVRRAAAEDLGMFAMDAAVGSLSEERWVSLRATLLAALARPGEDPEVRGAALESVAVYGDEEIRQAIDLAYRSAEPVMKAKALAAMGNNLDPCWQPVVLRELKSSDPLMRYEAATTAGFMELGQAIPKLIELTRDADAEVRLAAITALGQVGGQAARQCLEGLMKSSDPAVSEQASTALYEMAFTENPLASLPIDVPLKPPERIKKP